MTLEALPPSRSAHALSGRRAVLLALIGLGACAEQVIGPLPYVPGGGPAPRRAARGLVRLGTVTDLRRGGAETPDWVGAVRGNVGNRLAVVRTAGSVRDVTAHAFGEALAARGLLAPSGRERRVLDVTILRLDAAQAVRREGNAEFAAALTDPASGATLWRGTGQAELLEGRLSGAEPLGTAAEVRDIAARAMSEAIARVLDDPGFRAAAE